MVDDQIKSTTNNVPLIANPTNMRHIWVFTIYIINSQSFGDDEGFNFNLPIHLSVIIYSYNMI